MSNPIPTIIACLIFIAIMAFQLYPSDRELKPAFVVGVCLTILFALLIIAATLFIARVKRQTQRQLSSDPEHKP